MRGILRAIIVATAAACGAVAIFLALTLPPRTVRLDAGSTTPGVVFGAYHVHTNRSDGTGSVDAIAEAAARAGLTFVILTDHGDATRTPDAPAYRHGVLVLDGVEISVEQGHLVALGLATASPYPLAGDAAAVIDDVHRLGGVAIVAHPDSPNPALRWRGGFGNADGVEWINVDSEWRDETSSRLLATAARSLLRQPEAIASLFARPDRTLQRWDASLPARRVFSIAAVDAHARIGWEETQEPRGRTALAWPSYESVFRTVSQGVEVDAPLTTDAPADAARLLSALAAGRSFSLVRAFGAPAHLEFTATDGTTTTPAGGQAAAGAVTLHARVPEAPGTRIAIMRDGREVAHGNGSVSLGVDGGVYRVEVGWPGASAPWIVSNAIAVGPRTPPDVNPDDADLSPVVALETDSPWTIERDASSTGAIATEAGELAFSFRLGTGAPAGQYAALTTSVKSLVGADRVTFTARADRPMRVSLQLRLPGGKDGERWRQSVYVDEQPRQITVRLRDLAAVGVTTTRRPFVAPIQGLLFVVDTVNTKPGTAGTLWISDIGIGAR